MTPKFSDPHPPEENDYIDPPPTELEAWLEWLAEPEPEESPRPGDWFGRPKADIAV
jgi:hypothetical protein